MTKKILGGIYDNLYGGKTVDATGTVFSYKDAILASKQEQMNPRYTTNETNPKDLIGATKPPLTLVPGAGLIHCSLAMKNGADKYGAFNWRTKKVQTMIYLDAAIRHIVSYVDGEETAEDSGVHHLGHAMACLAILLDAKETGNLIDNRPSKGIAANLIKEKTINAKKD